MRSKYAEDSFDTDAWDSWMASVTRYGVETAWASRGPFLSLGILGVDWAKEAAEALSRFGGSLAAAAWKALKSVLSLMRSSVRAIG